MGIQTAERVSDKDLSDNFVYQRSLLAYYEAAEIVSGNVLEIGTGSGYGIEIIAPKVDKFISIDKFDTDIDLKGIDNVELVKMTIPPFKGIEDNSFDFVITFQVIEHIQDDEKFVSEIYRVLKKGGKLIVTTPNKKMSLSRNPWHIREYTINELDVLLKKHFEEVEKFTIKGVNKAIEYYNENKESIKRYTRFDIFNFQYLLPRQLLQIPYDILNRMNRNKMLEENNTLVSQITMDDFKLGEAEDIGYDLFYVAQKKQ